MSNPRKFSEKIALHSQKQAEGTAAFEAIMKEVSSTTKVCLVWHQNLIIPIISTMSNKRFLIQIVFFKYFIQIQQAALARKIANKQHQQQLLSQQNHHIANESQQPQHPQDPPSLPNSFVYNSGQHLIRQEPIAYKGQSLPNVNQMVNKPIDLKVELFNAKHG